MVASAEQLHHEEAKTRSNWCPIEKSAQSRKSVDRFPAPVIRPLLSSAASVVKKAAQ